MNILLIVALSSALLGLAALLLLVRAVRRSRRRRAEAREKDRVAKETAHRHAKIIEESKRALEKTRSPAVISARFEVIRDHAEKLSALAEHHDLPDIPAATPVELKAYCREEKDRVLRDRVMEQVEEALAKAVEAPKRPAKVTYLERALILCLEGKRVTGDEELAQEFGAQAERIKELIGKLLSEPRP